MKKQIHEILDEFEAALTRNEKLRVLQNNNSDVLREVLYYTFQPDIEWAIKEPVERRSDTHMDDFGYTSMEYALRKLYLFHASKVLPEEKRKILLIQTLEGMDNKEAEVYQNMILKDLKIEGLTSAIVEEAFPGLLNFHANTQKSTERKGEFHPTIEDCEHWFRILSKKVFDIDLKMVDSFSIESSEENLGCYYIYPRTGWCMIHVEEKFENMKAFLELLGHEMVHHYQHLINGEEHPDHGENFIVWKPQFVKLGMELKEIL